MKRNLIICFMLFISQVVYAQVEIGFKGGYNVSQVVFQPAIGLNLDFLPGIQAGVVAKVSANPNVALQAELNFSQKGWIEDFESANDPLEISSLGLDRTQTYRYNYIDLPILSHIYVGGKRINVFLNLGPHFSFLIGVDSTSSSQKLETDVPTYSYVSSTAINFEYGVTAGAGIAVKTGKGTFQLEARLTHGLNNIIDRDTPDAPTQSLNQLVGISLTYFFKVKKKKIEQDSDPPPTTEE